MRSSDERYCRWSAPPGSYRRADNCAPNVQSAESTDPLDFDIVESRSEGPIQLQPNKIINKFTLNF